MSLMVVVGYTLAWLPLNLFQLYMVRPSEESPLPHIEYVFFSVHWLAMAHTAYNPLIYAWINIRFRSAFLQVTNNLIAIPNAFIVQEEERRKQCKLFYRYW
jgi:hypothetical protein